MKLGFHFDNSLIRRFGDKEEYMKFMNVFVREQWDQMGSFLNDVADVNKTTTGNGFEGFIDVGREMAKLHAFMRDSITEMEQVKKLTVRK